MGLVKVSPTKIGEQERSAMIESWAPKKIALVHGRRMVPHDGQKGVIFKEALHFGNFIVIISAISKM